ncbi:hypothetical protein HID58_057807 [Brassica napus]|uniref:Uncharacterized protein n=1 Tax=Brassica napus TaxID=3708 RepID=A0ABQ7XGY5_BRANA|nr:hypothetical protein HID58_057807 [Brassica napus]
MESGRYSSSTSIHREGAQNYVSPLCDMVLDPLMFIIVLNTVVLRFIFIRIMLLELCFSSLQNGLNDILEKGTAFRVSENEGLLETMNHLTLKLRDEVKKLLNSKHLFLRRRDICLSQPLQPSRPTASGYESTSFGAAELKLERLAASEEEEESEMAEGSESETEETSKKQRRVEGVSAEDDLVKIVCEKELMRRKALKPKERKIGYEWR